MVVKQDVNSLYQVVSKKQSFWTWYERISPIGKKENVVFPDIQSGVGKYVWRWDGDNWQKFSSAPDSEKPFIAREYDKRKNNIQTALKDSILRNDIFTVPEDGEFIYYRKNEDGMYEFAVAAWGFKYPNKPIGNEIYTWITKIPMQDVNIAFAWNGKKCSEIDFSLNNLPKKTGKDGFYRIGVLPVGERHQITCPDQKTETLEVTQGQSEYIYDLTKYFNVEISIIKDGLPVENGICEVYFNKKSNEVTTNTDGKASLHLPLLCNDAAKIANPQPPVKVSYTNDSQDKTPSTEEEILKFLFQYETPKPPEPEPEHAPEPEPQPVNTPQPQHIHEPEPKKEMVMFTVLDYGGHPMPNLDIVLMTKIKGEIPLSTNGEGKCSVPKEWFTPGEKLNVKFKVSDEYQASHDIHDPKKRK